MNKKMNKIFLIASSLLSISASFASDVTEGVFVVDSAKHYLKTISQNKELTIDHVRASGFEVYGPYGLKNWLTQQKIPFFVPKLSKGIADKYPSYDQLKQKMIDLNKKFPKISKLISVGKSNDGNDLLFMKISRAPEQDLTLPEVKFISSMHGDEITGRELMMFLIQDILNGYGSNKQITDLVDNTEIFIMPSMNPDGSTRIQRGNAKNIDLNRNFPDITGDDNQNNPAGRAIETQNIMKFQASRQFALSANFHGGSEVVNYPWDATYDLHPFDGLLKEISLNYAGQVSYMKNSSEFPGGITNGAAWYIVKGGMQDWSYIWHNDLQVTVELSGVKYPDYRYIPNYYKENREALLGFLSDVHQGAGFVIRNSQIGGLKTTASGKVTITSVSANNKTLNLGTYGFTGGEFYKVLPTGNYQFAVQTNDGRKILSPVITVRKGTIITDGNYVTL